MGLYDHLFIPTDKLPVSDEEKAVIGPRPGWQTKSLDCNMTDVYILTDGQLVIEHCEYEHVPKHERPYPNDDGIKGYYGSVRITRKWLVPDEFTGVVNFYSSIGKDWYEFNAVFEKGMLQNISGGKRDFMLDIM